MFAQSTKQENRQSRSCTRVRGLRSARLMLLGGTIAVSGVGCSRAVDETASVDAPATAQQALSADQWNYQANAFYAMDNLLTVDITMDPSEWEELKNAYPLPDGVWCDPTYTGDRFETYEPTSVRINGTHTGDFTESAVEIRKKSWCGSFSTVKPALRIKFKKSIMNAVQDKIGTRYVMLNNSVQDPSFLRQCLGFRLLQDAGLPYARCNFALVRVNGVPIQDGLYVNVEPVEERYLFNNFNRNTTSNLYELEIGEDFVPEMLERTEWKGFSLYDNKLDFVRATEEIAAGNLESVVDIDQFIRTWAMEILLQHWDDYSIGRNNAYLYNDTFPVENPSVANGDVKFKFITSGIDQILQELPDHSPVDFTARGVLAQKVLENPVLKAKLYHQIYVYLGTVFSPKAINTLLAPWVLTMEATANSIVPVVPNASGITLLRTLVKARSKVDTYFGVTAPTTTVTLEGPNNECAHRGRSAVGDVGWSLDHKPCSEATTEAYRFNLEPSGLSGYFKLTYQESGAPYKYVLRADTSHAVTSGVLEVFYGQGGDDSDYSQFFSLIPVGDGDARRYELQSLESGRCMQYSTDWTTSEGNYRIIQADCDPANNELIKLAVASTTCTEATAVDLGAPGINVTVPTDGCVMVRNGYPSWWGINQSMHLQNTAPGNYPVPFTWSSSCAASGGIGSFTGDWQSQVLGTTSAQCATLIDLQGTPGGKITLRYY